jgi:predicted transcriptional regulator
MFEMPTRKSLESILFEQHVIALLLFLLEERQVKATELKSVSGNYMKLTILAERLKQLGLIQIQKEEKPRLMFTYSLTSTGKKVAEKLREAKEMIEE